MSISNIEEFSAYVVVIGGGDGGLTEEVTAAEAGAKKVTILEWNRILGGTGRIPAGFFALESTIQKQLGIKYTADDCFKIAMEKSEWTLDARLVRTWFTGSGNMVRWLEEKGIDLEVAPLPQQVCLQLRGKPLKTGNTIMNTMIENCKEKGVQMLTETRAHKLLTDDKGNVTGVLATQNGKEIRITAKSVIIASGSIAGNKKLMKRYFPHINFKNVRIMAALPNTHNMGDGLLMAEEAGAAKNGVVTPLWMGPGNHTMNAFVTTILHRPYMMWVNKYGMRFVSETIWAGLAMTMQPDHLAYSLMDDKVLRDIIIEKGKKEPMDFEESVNLLLDDDKDNLTAAVDRETGPKVRKVSNTHWLDKLEDAIHSEVKQGNVKISDSWDDIAKWIGADHAVLKDQVERYNTFCQNGYDAEFLKPKELLMPLSTPPYYALKAGLGMDTPFGGIRINDQMEVLNKEIKPMGGLYAAGTICSGWFFGMILGATPMGFSLFSGYAAGKNAATYAKSGGK